MKPINTRKDIEILVHTFYKKIRHDDLLGPIFNSHISEQDWPIHLDKLTDFWETNLFRVAKFKGNPTKVHLNVDKQLEYTVNQSHFGQWLQLWFQTIDELYEGVLAERAKNSARNMSHSQFIAIWKGRPK